MLKCLSKINDDFVMCWPFYKNRWKICRWYRCGILLMILCSVDLCSICLF